jgi:hypothetical protein
MKKFPKEKDTQFNQEFIFTIVWNPRGFRLIKVLENGCKFNAGYYITGILESLSQWPSIEAEGNEQNCWCMRTVRAGILPSYQLTILTRIE